MMVDGKVVVDKHAGGYNVGVLAINEGVDDEETSVVMCSTSEYEILKERYTHVLAGGTMLVNYGEELEQEPSPRSARTIIGTDKSGNMLMLMVNANGGGDGATLAEAAFMARVSGLVCAMCLDASSSVWVNDGVSEAPAEAAGETVVYAVRNLPFKSGDGSADNPYVIATPRHLGNMRNMLESDETVYFELANDIDMTGMAWLPLNGDEPYNKRIVFDGKGHTISNLKCSERVYPSFFGVLYGECRNVFFKDAEITATWQCAGIVAGYCGTGGKPALVEQVHVSGVVKSAAGTCPQIGGICGQSLYGTIRNCYADVEISRGTVEYNIGSGGIIGKVRDNCTVECCYATGSINAIKYDNSGSIWGRAEGNLGWTLQNNIGWMSYIRSAWASNAVGGRTYRQGNNTIGRNYGNANIKLELFADDNPSPPYLDGETASEPGTPTEDIIAAARDLGWDEEIWDLSGAMPKFHWEK